jgi:hypothetical protein
MIHSNATSKDLAKFVYEKLLAAKIDLPVSEVLDSLFENLFYASLKTEESQFINVTITFINPRNPDPKPPARIVQDRWNIIRFKEEIPFTIKNLVKISKAADPWSSSLAVYYNNSNDLIIWGMIDQAIHSQTFLSYESESGPEKPGIFQASITGIGNLMVMFDYELIATLKQNTLITNYIDVFKFGPISEILNTNAEPFKVKLKSFIKKKFPNDDIDFWLEHIEDLYKESLSRILLRIQNYKHGGAILITKENSNDIEIKHKIEYDRLASSILKNTYYTIENNNYYQEIDDLYLDTHRKTMPVKLYLDESVSDFEKTDTTSEIKGVIRFISSLSCIDGLILMTPELKVRGFGTVIKLEEIPLSVYSSTTSKIKQNSLTQIPSNHYGTRHRSMFSYCWNHPRSLGFVISQDGDIRAITRIENKLIMWDNVKVQKYLRSHKLLKKSNKK